MLSNLPGHKIILVNFALMIVWHLLILVICANLKNSFFDPRKKLYVPRKWEKNGKFYVKILKIKKWKDYLPQHVAKNGFSKRRLESKSRMDIKYLNIFIAETCRAEWNHLMCSLYFIISFSINSFYYNWLFSLIPIIANLPFLVIQRYNRLRLQQLLSRKLKTAGEI